jgi:hypothetical protein
MVVSSRPSATLWRRLPRAFWAGLALAATLAAAFMACGGTTGREGLPGTPADGGSIDSTMDVGAPLAEASRADSGSDGDLLDAGIQYADPGRLPEGGGADGSVADAGGPGAQPCWAHWPDCTQDKWGPRSAFSTTDDAGTCATHIWTGSSACDQCLRANACGPDWGDAAALASGNEGVLPPCVDLREAGTAAQGSRAGDPLYAICADLLLCVMRSRCVTDAGVSDPNANVTNCYCGANSGAACLQEGGANGACKDQIQAAMQATPSTDPSYIVGHITDPSIAAIRPNYDVMALINCALTAGCSACFSGSLDPCSSGDTTGGPADAGTQ